jgi:hypothetical protein
MMKEMKSGLRQTIVDSTDGGAYQYTNEQLYNLYFAVRTVDDEGKMECSICNRKIKVGNGFTNRVNHIKCQSGHNSEWRNRLLNYLKGKKRTRSMFELVMQADDRSR